MTMSLALSFTTLLASFAGLRLLVRLLQRSSRVRYPAALIVITGLFSLFHMILMLLLLSREIAVREVALHGLGIILFILLIACVLLAKPFLFEKPNTRWLGSAAVALAMILGFLHFRTGFFQLLEGAGNAVEVELTAGGKYLLAFTIAGSVVLLSKFEAISVVLSARLGRWSRAITYALFLLAVAVTVLCTDSLAYGRIRSLYGAGFQILVTIFCGMLGQAVKALPILETRPAFSKIRVTQFFSSEVLIFGGAYLIVSGLVIKLAMMLGGSWHEFVSSLAAIGIFVLALLLVSGTSIRERWTGFLDRNLFHRNYDFRTELQSITEAISTASNLEQLFREICRSMREIFSTKQVCLLIEEDEVAAFRPFTLHTDGILESHSRVILLTKAQLEWSQRVDRCFSPEKLLALPEKDQASTALGVFLAGREYELGSVLHAGQHVAGFAFLGGREKYKHFSMEDRLLFDTLTPALSISIHSLRLQQRMVQARQMESIHRVAAFIMHDLRNAVSTLTLLARNAKRHIDTPGFRGDFIETLARLSDEMLHLMNKLTVVKSDGGLRDRNRCDPAQLLSEALLDLQLPDEIKLVAEIPALPAAFWDQRLIRVVLRNILGNAVEAMPAGGMLEVGARQQSAEIIITIKDTGSGMSDDFMRKHLFRPNHSTKSKGLGIGLYQSREIVLAHQGKIQAQSQPGHGTTFEIRLPCSSDGELSESLAGSTPGEAWLPENTVSQRHARIASWNLNASCLPGRISNCFATSCERA